jgi:FKBP-type peptidyl-prolyl cis-trans isomerase
MVAVDLANMNKAMMFAALLLAACQRGEDPATGSAAGGVDQGERRANDFVDDVPTVPAVTPPRKAITQMTAPADLQVPPMDAIKTQSGLMYRKLLAIVDGVKPSGNDTVLVKYTTWKRSTGETVFSTETREPVPIALGNSAPGFAQALTEMHKGEKARVWVPAALGDKGGANAGDDLVYDVEVVDVQVAPKTPVDVAKAPASAKSLVQGTKYEVVKTGKGARARSFDNVTFHYTVWDASGKMMDSSEMRSRPATAPPFRMPAGLSDVLTSMASGERKRFWLPADVMGSGEGTPKGDLCFEVEIVSIAKPKVEPPAAPKDVVAPPNDVKKTVKGVSYRLLKAGKSSAKPAATDSVVVQYTGWTVDGKMFDSSRVGDEPATVSLTAVIAGWTDGIQMMSIGDSMRFWIPAELAYRGEAGKPKGMLVFDIELLDIKRSMVELEAAGEP